VWLTIIGGNDYSPYVPFDSWRIEGSIRHLGSQASCTVILPRGSLPRPKGFQQIVLRWDSPPIFLFGGIITRVDQHPTGNPDVYAYELTCVDYTRWLDHIPAGAGAYTGTADAVVRQLIQDWVNPGTLAANLGLPAVAAPIDTQGVQSIPVTIYGFNPNYLPVSQCIDQIAKMVEAVWYVDPLGSLVFANPDSTYLFAPLPVESFSYFDQGRQQTVTEQLPVLHADTELPPPAGNISYYDLILSEDISGTISGVTVKDYFAVTTQPVTENNQNNAKLVGDGMTRFFPLYNRPVDPAHTTVTVGNKVYSVANHNLKTEYVDGDPANPTADDWCFVCSTNQGIRFNQPPANGQGITVTYQYYEPGFDLQTVPALASIIAAREGFGGGYYLDVISDPNLTAPISLTDGTPPWLAAEQIRLNRYARIKLYADFHVRLFGGAGIWLPGMVFGIVSSQRGDTADSADTAWTGWGTTFRNKFYTVQTEVTLLNEFWYDVHVIAATDIWGE
jgi:hypothetical protein